MMPGLFDEQFLLKKLDQKVDPLDRLNSIVDWQRFLPIIEQALGRDKASTAGRKPYPPLFMFKILILQSLYNQSDEETERFLLRDLLARRFVGLSGGEFGPDFTTIWRFKEALTEAGVLGALHDAFSKQLDELGFQASKGQIVDAGIVPAPRQRNSREENEAIREGNPPAEWSEAKRRQKDVDARWTKKREQNHFGYKNHIAVDVKHKFIRAWRVTAANVHDSQVFLELLARNTSRDVYADSAYLSEESQKRLKALGYRAHIQRKGQKNHPLSAWEKQGNRTRSRIRCRVEHVFGAQLQRAGTLLVRCIGLARARAKIGLRIWPTTWIGWAFWPGPAERSDRTTAPGGWKRGKKRRFEGDRARKRSGRPAHHPLNPQTGCGGLPQKIDRQPLRSRIKEFCKVP